MLKEQMRIAFTLGIFATCSIVGCGAAKQIDQAANFGVDVFIFDWYWYSGVQILHRPVEETLPKTPNRDKIKYALMWADHPGSTTSP